MKTNSKKKIVVSTLAIAMGAALVGSISGSVAWYQYSTRVSAAIAGTSAGTSRNLEISSDDGAHWSNHIDLGSKKFRPCSVYGSADALSFVEHPVYQHAILPAMDTNELGSGEDATVLYAEYSLVFRCTDNNGTAAQVAKKVYLTQLNIVPKTGDLDITAAVRIAIDGDHDFLVAKTAGATTTKGNLDIGGATGTDTDGDGWSTTDTLGSPVEYKNAESGGDSYTCVAPASVKVDDSNAYTFSGTTNKDLTETKTGSAASDAVNIKIWLEGWQPLGSPASTLWDTTYIAQNFDIQMQFAVEADR